MPDVSQKFLGKIQSKVYKRQAKMARTLTGRYVMRSGVTFLVVGVSVKRNTIIVSDVKTAVKQVSNMSLKSFLGKKVTIVDKEEK